MAEALHIPDPFDEIIFGSLQILVTVVCTNLTMLILQKADLFDVRFGYKINAVKKIFADEYNEYERQMSIVGHYVETDVQAMIVQARKDSLEIYESLKELNPYQDSVRPHLSRLGHMFNVYVDYESAWDKFIGRNFPQKIDMDKYDDGPFQLDYTYSDEDAMAALSLYYYFAKRDSRLFKEYPIENFLFSPDIQPAAGELVRIEPFLFGNTQKYLDLVSDSTLTSLNKMVGVLSINGIGETAKKNAARQRFEKYLSNRKLDAGVQM